MSQTNTIQNYLKTLPSSSLLENLSLLLVDSQGNPMNIKASDFSEALLHLLFAPQSFAQDIDNQIRAGIYLVETLSSSGTFPDIPLAQYGHLIVLRRGDTVQHILITRNAISLRFRAHYSQSEWSAWVVLS